MNIKLSAVLLLIFVATPVLFAANGRLLLVANQVDHTLVLVDPDSGKTEGSVTVGVNDHEVAASPDGKFAYVPIYGNSALGVAGTDGHTIDVVDLATHKVAYSIDLGKPVRPHKALFGPGGLLYVTGELADEVLIVDPHTRRVIGSIPTRAPQTHMIAVNGDRIYTSNVAVGSVSVLNLNDRRNVRVVKASSSPTQRITVTPDGRWAFTHAADGKVIVIDTRTLQVKTSINVPGKPFSSVATPDSRFLVALLDTTNEAAVIDLSKFRVIHVIPLGGSPMEAIADPRGNVAYISLFDTGQVVLLDLHSWKITRRINLTRGVDGLAFAGQ